MAINWTGALQGGLGGAGSGAAIGSMFAPGIGTGIGGGIGAIIGSLGGLFGGGKEGRVQQAQNYSPQQQNALNLLLNMGTKNISNPYEGFEPIAQRARSQFEQKTIPMLAERFTAMGNGRRSSAFEGALGSAGAGLEEGLAALQSQYGMQNQQNALNLLSLGLSPLFENFYQQSQPGFGENLFTGSIQAAPSFYQSYQLLNALKALQSLQS